MQYSDALHAIRHNWPAYLIEAAGLGTFMVIAGLAGTMLEYPLSPLHQQVGSPVLRRALMGLAMGVTAALIVYSPWGKRSGAHLNPALTLAFAYAGKVRLWDGAFYILAQFAGGWAGVILVHRLLGDAFAAAPVLYIVTVPGPWGRAAAFICECAISFILMLAILYTSNRGRWARYTGALSGLLIATYVTVEAPYSGMSMNPARTVASALPAGIWTALWIYFVAPVGSMIAAVALYRRLSANKHIACAKLSHDASGACHFICSYAGSANSVQLPPPALADFQNRAGPT